MPATQALTLRVNSGTPAYLTTTPAANPWLIATPDSGFLPASLVVQVNPFTLAPGTYVSLVTITAAGGIAPLVVPVTLTVTSAPGVTVVAPTTIPLASPGTLTGTFTITAGSLPATFTATSGTAWLSVSTNAGALLPAQSQTVTVTATPGTLVPQAAAYAGKLTVVINSNGSSTTQTLAVNLTVNPQTPVAASLWPLQVTTGSPDTTVTIRGANFYSGTTVTATGLATPLKTTVVSNDVILAVVPAPSLATAGVLGITVANPAGRSGRTACSYGWECLRYLRHHERRQLRAQCDQPRRNYCDLRAKYRAHCAGSVDSGRWLCSNQSRRSHGDDRRTGRADCVCE